LAVPSLHVRYADWPAHALAQASGLRLAACGLRLAVKMITTSIRAHTAIAALPISPIRVAVGFRPRPRRPGCHRPDCAGAPRPSWSSENRRGRYRAQDAQPHPAHPFQATRRATAYRVNPHAGPNLCRSQAIPPRALSRDHAPRSAPITSTPRATNPRASTGASSLTLSGVSIRRETPWRT
jgi:hypothetical protein